MPIDKSNILDIDIIESSVIPSLIYWKSKRPILILKKNQFALEIFEIELSKTQKYFNSF